MKNIQIKRKPVCVILHVNFVFVLQLQWLFLYIHAIIISSRSSVRSAVISFEQVKDDFCDCRDGSDEPGTPACMNGSFAYQNHGYIIHLTRLNTRRRVVASTTAFLLHFSTYVLQLYLLLFNNKKKQRWFFYLTYSFIIE